MDTNRCRWAISLGWYPGIIPPPAEAAGLHTRCKLEADGHDKHEGKGLAQFDYQRWFWFTSDRRSYVTDRTDEHAWEVLVSS